MNLTGLAAKRERLRVHGWWCALLLVVPLARAADQFIELTAEIEMNDWDACFFFDGQGRWPARETAPSLFTVNHTRHCVVGTTTWMIAAPSERGRSTYWFTGTNVISNFLVARQPPQGERKDLSRPGFPAATSLPAGEHFTLIAESSDGNPGRPGGVADLMSFDVPSRICWLAFCSGPALNRAGRKLYPPSDLWKESGIYYYGWADQTSVFSDDLGLPRHIDLLSTNQQPIFQYQVHLTTNVLGWTFPFEFYGVQYVPTLTNNWKVHLTFKGRLTSIAVGAKPQIPAEIMKHVRESFPK